MKPTPLLDLWTPPSGAGDPVAVLATTFTLEPDFFERDCLARFLSVSSVSEDTGTAEDTVARIELEEKLAEPRITVLADRSTRADRSSLRWDLLHCAVGGGLLHAKVAVLMWEKATRVLVGSANLTSAGYRRQIEMAMAAEFGPRCLFTTELLTRFADELSSYLRLIPGYTAVNPQTVRAEKTVALLRQRSAELRPRAGDGTKLRVALAPSASGHSPLDLVDRVWQGPNPTRATQLSPFWDKTDLTVVTRVNQLLTGRGLPRHVVASVLTPEGSLPVPQGVRSLVDAVCELDRHDQELRTLHAKCLLIESDRWVAALVGSSNHTRAGLGLTRKASHRELNVWLGAPIQSEEGRWLRALIAPGRPVPAEVESAETIDEDDDESLPPMLPLGFEFCRLQIAGWHDGSATWCLRFQLKPNDLPRDWSLRTVGGHKLLTASQWGAGGKKRDPVVDLPAGQLPTYVDVNWDGNTATWTVVVDDPHLLPPSPEVASLSIRQLLAALAAGKSVAAALRDEFAAQLDRPAGVPEDPLRRFDDRGYLLREGRALAGALTQLRRRLERPVLALDALEARLGSPLGPKHLSDKVLESVRGKDHSSAQGLFTVAEITLTLARVDWARACTHVNLREAIGLVNKAVDHLDRVRNDIGAQPTQMVEYAKRAVQEARRCLLF